MICLDANFLIGGLIEARPESRHLLAWSAAGEIFCTPAPAWYEFLCGPITTAQIETMQAFLGGGIIPFTSDQAQIAAQLYNLSERPRRLRVDAMIAATAISCQAALATLNTADFKLFASHGLKFAIPLAP